MSENKKFKRIKNFPKKWEKIKAKVSYCGCVLNENKHFFRKNSSKFEMHPRRNKREASLENKKRDTKILLCVFGFFMASRFNGNKLYILLFCTCCFNQTYRENSFASITSYDKVS